MRLLKSFLREKIQQELEETFLRESRKKMEVSIDPRILKQAKKLEDKRGHIFIKDLGDTVIISLNIGVSSKISLEHDIDRKIDYKIKHKINDLGEEIGEVELEKQDVSKENKYQSRNKSKKNASGIKVGGSKRKKIWQVVNSGIKEAYLSYGLGPIMYEVGIEYISKFKNCAVMAHEFNSADAFNVWKKFDERQDFEKYQLDIDLDSSSMRISSTDSVEAEQLTPGDDSDDIFFGMGMLLRHSDLSPEELAKNWSTSPLTRAFFNDRGRVIKFLNNKGIIHKV